MIDHHGGVEPQWVTMRWRSRLAIGGVVVTLLMVALAVARRFDPLPQGLEAEYFANTTWTPPSVVSTVDRQPSTDRVIEAWRGSPPDTFSTTWTGAVIALREGTYTFATVSDDGSSVFIDGQLVVDNGGLHSTKLATGAVHLASGVHAALIRYFQGGGQFHFEFLWARDGSQLEPVPGWALRPRKVRSFARAMPSLMADVSLAAIEWIWVGVLLMAGAIVVWPTVVRSRRFLEQNTSWPALKWILAGSLVLNVTGIWWGLPGRWVPIELDPDYVLDGLSQHFARGWYSWYPPLHFYLLAIAMTPVLLLQSLGRLTLDSAVGVTLSLLICRLVSVAAGVGIVIAACLCGTVAFGRRVGVFAAAIVAVTTPFVYYSKTANVDVPYLFWSAWSLLFYMRMLDSARVRDYALFAACATLAVCTKDQAYALYLLVPPAAIYQTWRVNRQAGRSHAWWRAVFDRRLVAAGITSVVLFALCQNLLFNFNGFVNHVRLLTGRTSVYFRVFEPTTSGHLQLLGLTIHLIEVSLGWPLFLVCVAGLVVAAATRHLRRLTVWLVLPVVSYYFGVINLLLYNYDRFVLPICFVLALFGGLALDRFLASSGSGRGQPWRMLAVTGIFAYTLLYAATVDVLMVGDSRYVVEDWMRMHIRRDDLVATTGLREYLPRIDDFKRVDVGTIAELKRERPMYVVLNADYSHAVPSDSPWGQFIAGIQQGILGYRLAFRFRRASPWPWLPGAHQDLVGAREETVVFSTLHNINPTIEVFQRVRASSP